MIDRLKKGCDHRGGIQVDISSQEMAVNRQAAWAQDISTKYTLARIEKQLDPLDRRSALVGSIL
jgi:hypothetical protein